MSLDRLALGDDQSAGCDEFFTQLSLEVLAFLHLLGVKGIFQLDDETGAVWNGVWRRAISDRGPDPSRVGCRCWRGNGCISAVSRRTGLKHWIIGTPGFLADGNQTQTQDNGTHGSRPFKLHGVSPQ